MPSLDSTTSKTVNSARRPGASRSLVGRPRMAIGRTVAAATTSSNGMPAASSFAMVVARSQTGWSRNAQVQVRRYGLRQQP